MNTKWIGLGMLGAIAILGVIAFGSYLSTTNEAARFENLIPAKYQDNQNVLGQGVNKVREVAQVPRLQEKALEKLAVAAISARENGRTGEMMRWVQEQNPQLDQKTFVKIQQTMEEFRNQFRQSQTELLDMEKEYRNLCTATVSGRFWLGSPRIDLAKYKIVTSKEAQAAFESGEQGPIQID